MGINGVGSFYAQNYDVPNRGRATRGKTSVDDFASMGSATSLSESSDNGKRIGLTAVGNVGYIAMYADSSTEQDPIVKVGDYEVRVKDVDPNNAYDAYKAGGEVHYFVNYKGAVSGLELEKSMKKLRAIVHCCQKGGKFLLNIDDKLLETLKVLDSVF